VKEKILDILELFFEMNGKYGLKTLEKKSKKLQAEIDSFCIRVLFVGEFSAGKSALLNAVIGMDLLKEGQRPETAIASEIIYDTQEYIEAVADGKKERYAVEEADSICTPEYDYLAWHLNRRELKSDDGYVLVDMPGFNSGMKDHNKAILQYAGKGNAYILVIDCEEGAVRKNLTDFIEEIRNYDDNMAIAVTKTDLKVEEDIAQIKDEIVLAASRYFGGNVPVVTTSKYDSKAGSKIRELISSFDQEQIFYQQFAPQVYELGIQYMDSLETYKKSLRLDISQFDEEVARHEKSKKKLSDQLNREKTKLEKKLRNSVGPAIVADVENALYSNTDTLADSLKAGSQNFSMTVNRILRPVLLSSTQQYIDQSFEQFLFEIDFSGMGMDQPLQEISSQTLDKLQQANSRLQRIAQDSGKYHALYKTIATTLAVATSVVTPWLELVIIFLPDILKLFTKGKQEDSLRDQVRQQIIPDIVQKLQPEIDRSLSDMKEEMILQAEEQISSLIDNEKESLETAKENKARQTNAFEQMTAQVQADLDHLRIAVDRIKA